MKRTALNVIFCIQILLLFFLIAGDRIELPVWLQVAGRLHPLVLHLPIGFLIFLVILFLFRRQFDKNSFAALINVGLLTTSLFASIAALFGFLLSFQDDYGAEALTWHKVTGVVFSWFCYGLVLLNESRIGARVFYVISSVAVVALIVVGHTGAVLTHGQNFVLAPIETKEELTAENASVYEFAVQPILDRKCFSCHNETKAKGGLVMTSIDKFKQGGDNGKPWVEGKPQESRMVKAFYLPISHDEHMPPDGKPQLTPLEISTIEAWIESGADFEKKLNQFADGDSLKFIVASFAASKTEATAPVEDNYLFEPASSEVIEKLNNPFRSVFPLHQNSPALQADFFLKESFQPEYLEELKAVADQLVVLNLSKMPVKNDQLKLISSFRNLEILNLNFTGVSGDDLSTLKSLSNLRSLSLAGTSVTATGLESVLSAPNLAEVYTWHTKISRSEKDALTKKYPDVRITGDLFSHDDEILRLDKPRLENEGVIRKGEKIVLRHNMPGVELRITTNGSMPDSLASPRYDSPMEIDKSMVLKAKACKDGWFCSDVLTVSCFVEGLKPSKAELLSKADKQYPGIGAPGLTDLQKGFADILKEPSWMGFREGPFSAVFDFEKETKVEGISLSHAQNIGGFVFPPQDVKIWAGNSPDKMELIAETKPEQPKGYTQNGVFPVFIPINKVAAYRYYKVLATPVPKLPDWHRSKGERGWLFVDEVFFY